MCTSDVIVFRGGVISLESLGEVGSEVLMQRSDHYFGCIVLTFRLWFLHVRMKLSQTDNCLPWCVRTSVHWSVARTQNDSRQVVQAEAHCRRDESLPPPHSRRFPFRTPSVRHECPHSRDEATTICSFNQIKTTASHTKFSPIHQSFTRRCRTDVPPRQQADIVGSAYDGSRVPTAPVDRKSAKAAVPFTDTFYQLCRAREV